MTLLDTIGRWLWAGIFATAGIIVAVLTLLAGAIAFLLLLALGLCCAAAVVAVITLILA